MGKKQHSKDRLFITRTEWNNEWGGYKEKKTHFHQLPFYCCALSLKPFQHPYCTKDGYLFDLTAILPYVKKNKTHPITGQKLSVKDLIKLTFYKNDDDEYHCPITNKIFNKSSYIVSISKTGNVYSYDAIKQLNINKNDFKDLMDNTPFAQSDIITIQNPKDPSRRHIQNFVHIARSNNNNSNNENDQYKIDETSNNHPDTDSNYVNHNLLTNHAQIRHNSATKRIFAQIKAENDKKGPPTKKIKLSQPKQTLTKNKINEYGLYNKYTTGKMAASFTSTVMAPVYKDELQPFTEEQVRKEKWRNVKGHGKKGYVRLVTNMGSLNFLLDCDYAPKTCYNFLGLCENGYYDNTIFHRNIMSFMLQGGDPEGSGHGGKCFWKTPSGKFEDEFHKLLSHDERGIIAMANSGPDTNGSQFYILYQASPHLDNKHSVFGRLVGGMNVLNRMEEVAVNEKNDKPLETIKILQTIVYQNPFNDPLPNQVKAEKERKQKEIEALDKERGHWWSNPIESVSGIYKKSNNTFEIGKYIKDKKLLKDRYGVVIGGRLLNLDEKHKKKKTKKKKRDKFLLPNPKTQNDLVDSDKHKKIEKSVFRFKDFELSKK